jgi:hypothetical protein
MNVYRTDLKVFFILVGIAILCQIVATPFLLDEPQLYVNWLSIPIYGGLGYLGMRFFLRRSGFKGMMHEEDGARQFILPSLIGLMFGIFAILFDLISDVEVPQLEFPISIPAYIPVAILDSMFWKLFILTMIVFVISGKIFKGKREEEVFWGASVAYSIFYVIIQFGQYSAFVGEISLYSVFQIVSVSGGFIMTSCWVFRRFGFLAAVIMHISQYLLYHGIYGGIY